MKKEACHGQTASAQCTPDHTGDPFSTMEGGVLSDGAPEAQRFGAAAWVETFSRLCSESMKFTCFSYHNTASGIWQVKIFTGVEKCLPGGAHTDGAPPGGGPHMDRCWVNCSTASPMFLAAFSAAFLMGF